MLILRLVLKSPSFPCSSSVLGTLDCSYFILRTVFLKKSSYSKKFKGKLCKNVSEDHLKLKKKYRGVKFCSCFQSSQEQTFPAKEHETHKISEFRVIQHELALLTTPAQPTATATALRKSTSLLWLILFSLPFLFCPINILFSCLL